nr:energy transducer TonB [uncultured Fluviicola sp.]
MRFVILFLLILFPVASTFAQSKKKKNEFLKQELNSRRESSDSLQVVYDFAEELRNGVGKKYLQIMDSFPEVEKEIFSLEMCLTLDQENLARLNDHRISSIIQVRLPKYQVASDLKKDLIVCKTHYESFHEESVPDEKLKIQNKWLENQIRESDSVLSINQQSKRNLEFCTKELNSLCNVLSEQLRQYKERVVYLRIESKKAADRLLELENSYRSKKGVGFPREYDEVFSMSGESIVKRLNEEKEFVPDSSIVYVYVDEQAEFPGGSVALMNYIRNNYHVPQIAEDLGISGKVRLKFTILEDGSVSDVRVERGMVDCPECDKEAVRVMEKMPKWTPGKLKGIAVKSWYNLPIQIHVR